MTLVLEPLDTRDESGHLLAYVYLSESDDLNLDLIHDGQAYADRRRGHSRHAAFEQAESEARKKSRGLWSEVTIEQQPRWRQEWFRKFLEQRATGAREAPSPSR